MASTQHRPTKKAKADADADAAQPKLAAVIAEALSDEDFEAKYPTRFGMLRLSQKLRKMPANPDISKISIKPILLQLGKDGMTALSCPYGLSSFGDSVALHCQVSSVPRAPSAH